MSDTGSSKNVGYDKEDPKPWAVAVAAFTILIFTFASGFVLQAYFDDYARMLYTKAVLETPNTEVIELRAEATKKLTTYGWVDQAAGVARMPIDEAMKLAVAEIKTKAAQPAPVAPKKK